MIDFNKPCHIGKEETAIQQAIANQKLSGNGSFGKKCTDWLENQLGCEKGMLTPSCTAALEMTALLTKSGPEDEIIMSSYTFVSTANAFALRGASIRFVDVEPKTMNISPAAIEAAITEQTKAIVVVHYAGVSCNMDAIMEIANRHGLWVIEDAAQALTSTYNGKPLGTIGHFGTFSFHETKNITCGEGGALIINHRDAIERAEILQEKGTNRKQFFKGMVDKYSWRDIGSSYLLSELNAAYLSVQLEHTDQIMADRMQMWQTYYEGLRDMETISLPYVPDNCTHNAHMFYIKTDRRSELIDYLKEHDIMAVTHYVSLHSSHAGKTFGQFVGKDDHTTAESEKIVRLPLYYGLEEKDVDHVISHIKRFFEI
ncbi:dTDP-4-amino-4,6-dideoxygalactose transaminase [Lentibacillus halodurans]|uniref:dTDP-4-amino-4,6-dideoxygalactose transaminase n=1 Tax=Lentibacillus halodurans TaxID=237679 RepID=A0A1I1A6E3_9BACI|nr:dTDP-4-amino-4,6-dideoxygalactose transaminase [Lentibacillus halodurans]SFB33072.1 dTDP-4-amino-4,6-dideoxygalactose transaminase [Lentibacillus halodurans]